MCPQCRQRQTSELNEQGKKRYSGTLPRRLLEIPTFLRNLTEYIDIKTFFILYAFFCQNTGTYSLKKPVNPRKLKVSSTAGRPSQHTLRRLNCSLFYLIGLWKHVQCLIGLRELINSYRLCFASTNQNLSA